MEFTFTSRLKGETFLWVILQYIVEWKRLLFSVSRPIAEGEVIGFYTGEVLSREELDTRYPDFEGSEYVMQIGPDTYLDAKDPDKSGFTRCIDCPAQCGAVRCGAVRWSMVRCGVMWYGKRRSGAG